LSFIKKRGATFPLLSPLAAFQLSFLCFPKISAELQIKSLLLALNLSLRIASLLKWKTLSRNGSSPENVTFGPPAGNLSTAGELNKVLREKSGELEIFLDPLHISAKVLKKCQNEVPSVTAWFTEQPMNMPSCSSVT
jgi:hypothetical protein